MLQARSDHDLFESVRCTFEVRPPPESSRRARAGPSPSSPGPGRNRGREGSPSAPSTHSASASPEFSSLDADADAPAIEPFSLNSSAGPSSPDPAARSAIRVLAPVPAPSRPAPPEAAAGADATDDTKRRPSSDRFAVALADMATQVAETEPQHEKAVGGAGQLLDAASRGDEKYSSAPELPARRCFYYEVQLVSAGVMQLGWCTKRSRFLAEEGHGVGDDFLSIGYCANHLLSSLLFCWKTMWLFCCCFFLYMY